MEKTDFVNNSSNWPVIIVYPFKAYKKRENGFIEWYFEVPPLTSPEPRKEKFSCQILTASFY